MPARPIRWMMTAVCAALLGVGAPALALVDDEAIGFERTPPRLSFIDGEVSFLRPGAEEWTLARVNTPLAAGDELYAAEAANLELQIGARAYVRAGENTELGLTSLEPDFLQLRVTSGHVSLDLRSLKTSQTLELATPNAAFTVEHTGYYRVEVDGETTTFTSRRGGRATLTPASGESIAIAASEQVVVTGDEAPQIESYAAPELDAWDRWNYARTDEQIDAVSARYVPAGVYGVDDLDHYGAWRLVPTYGAIWVPRGVAVGWAPYSTGRWIWDPHYGWTWVDDAPWGWAPYHYGRWVRVSGYWGWSPGPIVARPYYAPALVAFYGGGGFSIGVTIGTPYVGWFALGWGEPLIPWWGPARFRGHPRWAGWGGPRIVNKVVVKKTTVIRANEIRDYQNAHVRDAFVTADRRYFGRRDHHNAHYKRGKPGDFRPVYDKHPVRPDRSSLVAERGAGIRPPHEARKRPVVATREPRRDPTPEFGRRGGGSKPAPGSSRGARDAAPDAAPPVRVVQPARGGKRVPASSRAPFGKRGEGERAIPPPAPRFERSARSESERSTPRVRKQERQREETATRERVEQPRRESARRSTPRSERGGRGEQAAPRTRDLPGEPANRVFRQRPERQERPQSMSRKAQREARVKESGRSRAARQAPQDGGHRGPGGRRQGQSRGRWRRN